VAVTKSEQKSDLIEPERMQERNGTLNSALTCGLHEILNETDPSLDGIGVSARPMRARAAGQLVPLCDEILHDREAFAPVVQHINSIELLMLAATQLVLDCK
jgi:hypothetical protein